MVGATLNRRDASVAVENGASGIALADPAACQLQGGGGVAFLGHGAVVRTAGYPLSGGTAEPCSQQRSSISGDASRERGGVDAGDRGGQPGEQHVPVAPRDQIIDLYRGLPGEGGGGVERWRSRGPQRAGRVLREAACSSQHPCPVDECTAAASTALIARLVHCDAGQPRTIGISRQLRRRWPVLTYADLDQKVFAGLRVGGFSDRSPGVLADLNFHLLAVRRGESDVGSVIGAPLDREHGRDLHGEVPGSTCDAEADLVVLP
ncbi:hypothetical protein BG653_07349 [Streptomyces platensis]|uniref:Uncharacterized protein n=1 Tax=Streptomyces platensis TaxID=58346 RepID=A0ABX3XKL0_STRPT|nr:hypothetical protein BG653_07349 [Streptomyces platensis]